MKAAAAELDVRFGLESMVVLGAVASTVKERLAGDSALPALSAALTRIVYEPSAGKLDEENVYSQFPPAIAVVFQTSLALPKEVPFQ